VDCARSITEKLDKWGISNIKIHYEIIFEPKKPDLNKDKNIIQMLI